MYLTDINIPNILRGNKVECDQEIRKDKMCKAVRICSITKVQGQVAFRLNFTKKIGAVFQKSFLTV